jgi:hypothetical protein
MKGSIVEKVFINPFPDLEKSKILEKFEILHTEKYKM